MKIEKLNENKIRITLTFDELKKRKISLSELEKDANLAKDMLINILEETNIKNDFLVDDSHLYIEATSDNNNLFIVTVTRLDDVPELLKYPDISIGDQVPFRKYNDNDEKPKLKNNNFNYKVNSYIYSFDNIDTIIEMCQKSQNEDVYYGRNSLYKYDDTYHVIFSKSTVKNKKFLKTFVFLSEYCKNYYSSKLFEISLIEKSTLIIKNNALQKLSKI